jgi:hypothetical protein
MDAWYEYVRIARSHVDMHAFLQLCRTVFDRKGLHTTFVYNEKDAYINPEDIKYIVGKCEGMLPLHMCSSARVCVHVVYFAA